MQVRVVGSWVIAGLVLATGLIAQDPSGVPLAASGRLLSVGNASVVVRTDDGEDAGPFIITTTTRMPPGLAAGDRVTVYYRPVADRHVADRVVVGTATPGQQPAASRPPASE
jgi:hypothetical protein